MDNERFVQWDDLWLEQANFSPTTARRTTTIPEMPESEKSKKCARGHRPTRQPRRSLAIKSRRTNRLFRLNRLGSELAENLSEFFQSRNVIHRNELSYTRIAESDRDETRNRHRHRDDNDRARTGPNANATATTRQRKQKSPNQAPQSNSISGGNNNNNCVCPFELAYSASSTSFEPLKVAKLTHCSSSDYNKKPTVRRLLVDLISGRSGAKRSKLFLKLLKTPIFLAALFSSVLLVSLLILYTLSFHQHNQFEAKTKLLFHEILAPSSSSVGLELGDNLNKNATTSSQSHRINSRQLNQTEQTSASLTIEQLPVVSSIEQQPQPTRRPNESRTVGSQLSSSSNIVETECAYFEGVVSQEGETIVFKGIPYASPPTGSRRWSRPRPVWLDAESCPRLRQKQRQQQASKSSGSDLIIKANNFKQHCVQMSPISRRLSGSEDCLYLDIFSPTRKHRRQQTQELLPVMVYIHGGFLAFGSSGQGEQVDWMPARPTGQLAAELNVILVAPNYRLQALGFMALSQLAQNNLLDGSEGNYGLWDQLVALKWIKRNIESFGGNPNNIILFGPDSASALPLALLSQSKRPAADHSGGGGATSSRQSGKSEMNHDHHDTFPPISTTTDGEHGRPPRESTGGAVDGANTTWAQKPIISGPKLGQQKVFPRNDHHDEANKLTLNTRQRRQSKSQPPLAGQHHLDGELFHAAWLINPTVYYEQPYEIANQHYQRLIESQSVCSSSMESAAPPSGSTAATTALPSFSERPEQLRGSSRSLAPGGQFSQATDRMLSCLMNLTAEQVVREYLGKDDPAYRLDDQSSLPIRNIFADQFVTIDEELIQNSFPFELGGAEATAASEQSANEDEQTSSKLAKISKGKRLLIGSTAQAVEYWPCPRNLYNWNWDDFRRYVGTSLNSFSLETYKQASEVYLVPPAATAEDINGTKPPPLDSARSGRPFANDPIETYLTMVSDIRQICPINELSKELHQRAPKNLVERYIVEWRPSEQLSASLKQPANNCGLENETEMRDSSSGGEQDGRQTGEQRRANGNKIKTIPRQVALGQRDHPQQRPENATRGANVATSRPRFAFHYWDLLAFFGFHSLNRSPLSNGTRHQLDDERLKPSEHDLIFQTEIRKMVKEFAWNLNGKNSNEPREVANQQRDNNKTPSEDTTGPPDDVEQPGQQRQQSVKLFALDKTVGLLDKQMEYKQSECRMWQRFLKHSYAWLS